MIVAHSWVRWLVLLAGLAVLARAIVGMTGRKSWTAADDRGTVLFISAFDLQFVLGLLLMAVLGGAAGTRRVLEHAGGMIVAIALAHIGRVRIKRMPAGSSDRHRVALLFLGLSLAFVLLFIPWTAALFRF